jgi:hypothetical protein
VSAVLSDHARGVTVVRGGVVEDGDVEVGERPFRRVAEDSVELAVLPRRRSDRLSARVATRIRTAEALRFD